MWYRLWWLLFAGALAACGGSTAETASVPPVVAIATAVVSAAPAQSTTPGFAATTAPAQLPSAQNGSPAPAASTMPSESSHPTAGSNSPSAQPSATGLGIVIAIPTPPPSPTSTPVFSTPFFANGSGYGNCTSGLVVVTAPAAVMVPIGEPGYFGAFTALSSQPSIASGAVVNSLLTILARRSGTAAIKVSDLNGNANACGVTVL